MGKFFEPATTEEYVEAFLSSKSKISDKQLEVLRVQYSTTDKTVTASELADAVGYDHFLPANSLYGSIGHLLADELGRKPKRQTEQFKHWWSVLSTGESGDDGFEWTMRLQVAEALEELGWVEPGYQQLSEEDSVTKSESLREGAIREVKVNTYDRSAAARRKCIEHYGAKCYVCGFDFGERYGDVGQGLIHVHHEEPLAEVEEKQKVDPVEDLKPVCPNCHAIIHRREPPYSVDEVQEMLQELAV